MGVKFNAVENEQLNSLQRLEDFIKWGKNPSLHIIFSVYKCVFCACVLEKLSLRITKGNSILGWKYLLKYK